MAKEAVEVAASVELAARSVAVFGTALVGEGGLAVAHGLVEAVGIVQEEHEGAKGFIGGEDGAGEAEDAPEDGVKQKAVGPHGDRAQRAAGLWR